MKNIFLFTVSLMLTYGCGSSQSSDNKNKSSESIETTEVSSQTVESAPKNKSDHFTMVWVERKFEPAYSFAVMLQSYEDNVPVGKKKEIDLSSYGGDVMHSKYHASGSVGFPVQLNKDQTRAYCSIVKNDELEGDFYWAKLVEVQIGNGESRVIAQFDSFFPVWHYNEPNHTIYGYLPGDNQLVALNVASGEINTIKQFQHYQDEFDFYPQADGSITIITQSDEKKVVRHRLITDNNRITSTFVANIKDFSSYHNGFMVETYKDWGSDVEELRIYSGGEVKTSVPFDFGNFNTFWINDDEFACIKDDRLVKMNTQLKPTATFEKENIRIIGDLENAVFVSYGDHSNKTAALLSDDFKEVKVIKDINPDDIIALLK